MPSSPTSTCPFCSKGKLERKTMPQVFEYKGNKRKIAQPGDYCNVCKEGIVEAHDIKVTEKELHDFRAEVDGFLTSDNVRQIRKKLGLTQKQAAKIFGGGPNAFSRYENGEALQLRASDNLLRLLDRHPHLLAEIEVGEDEVAA